MNDGTIMSEYFRGFRNGMAVGVVSSTIGAFALGLLVGYWQAPAPQPSSAQQAAPVLAGVPPQPAAVNAATGLEMACLGYWFGDPLLNREALRRRVCGK